MARQGEGVTSPVAAAAATGVVSRFDALGRSGNRDTAGGLDPVDDTIQRSVRRSHPATSQGYCRVTPAISR